MTDMREPLRIELASAADIADSFVHFRGTSNLYVAAEDKYDGPNMGFCFTSDHGKDFHEKLVNAYENGYITPATEEHSQMSLAKRALAQPEHDVWRGILIIALAREECFQRLVADSWQSPGCVDLCLLRFNEDWLVGIYLPGYYCGCNDMNAFIVMLDNDMRRAFSEWCMGYR